MDDVIRRDHWDDRYRTVGPTHVSWYESEPRLSLAMLELGGLDHDRSVIDVGGGASSLSTRLVARGHRDVTVVDVSAEALRIARASIVDPDAVTFIETDITEWSPTRTWDLWHDRAVFHFLTGEDQRGRQRALPAHHTKWWRAAVQLGRGATPKVIGVDSGAQHIASLSAPASVPAPIDSASAVFTYHSHLMPSGPVTQVSTFSA